MVISIPHNAEQVTWYSESQDSPVPITGKQTRTDAPRVPPLMGEPLASLMVTGRKHGLSSRSGKRLGRKIIGKDAPVSTRARAGNDSPQTSSSTGMYKAKLRRAVGISARRVFFRLLQKPFTGRECVRSTQAESCKGAIKLHALGIAARAKDKQA